MPVGASTHEPQDSSTAWGLELTAQLSPELNPGSCNQSVGVGMGAGTWLSSLSDINAIHFQKYI